MDGTVECFKARVLARGYAQKYDIDYDEIFSPVVRFSSIRVLLAFAVQRDMLIHQMDVITPFLNGSLEEEIYMDQTEGCIKTGQEHLVYKLEKSLYRLKQAPRCWNKAFREHLENNGFTQTSSDACVYVKSKESLIVIVVYVDDLIILAETAEEIAKIKETLSTKFKMKDMKELHYCLGITIIHDRVKQKVWLNQYQYIEKLLKKFGQAEAKTMSTPADINVKLKKSDNVSKHVDTVRYQSIVGSLLYAAMITRPDIAYAVGVLSKFCTNPDESHLTTARRILRYLKGTINYGIKYEKSGNASLTGYPDASWADDLNDRRSTSGNVFLLANGPVSWFSKKQATLSMSTAESEYVALSQAAQEAVWLRRLLEEIGMDLTQNPTLIHEDNQGAIAIARNPVSHARTKHIDKRYHFVREAILNKVINLEYSPTHEMIADVLTKPLSKPQFTKLIHTMGMNTQ